MYFSRLTALLFIFSSVGYAVEKDDALMERSDAWPPYVTLTGETDVDGRLLPAGLRGTLVRLVDSEHGLIDFGRFGGLKLDMHSTDFGMQRQALLSGIEHKRFPNLVEMLGPRMLRIKDGRTVPLLFKNIWSRERDVACGFVFVYLDISDQGFAFLTELLQAIEEKVNAELILPVVLPKTEAQAKSLESELLSRKIEMTFLMGFAAMPYARVLDHRIEHDFTVIVSDADGRILARGTNDSDFDWKQLTDSFQLPLYAGVQSP